MDIFRRLDGGINFEDLHKVLLSSKDNGYIVFGWCTNILYDDTLFLFADQKQRIEHKIWLTSHECMQLARYFNIQFFNDILREFLET